jgi:hypothetical protein
MRNGSGPEDRLFDDQDVVLLRGAAEKVLRPLPDEVPSKMGEADEERTSGVRLHVRTRGKRRRGRTLLHSAILDLKGTLLRTDARSAD